MSASVGDMGGAGLLIFGLAAALLPAILPTFAAAAEIRLAIRGVRSNDGEVLVGLYDNAGAFNRAVATASRRGIVPGGGRLVGIQMLARRGTQTAVFTQLPPGKYAIIVIHDENDNGRLDKNVLGMPTEGYGFGNDAYRTFSAPSFDAAAIAVGHADLVVSVTLRYP